MPTSVLDFQESLHDIQYRDAYSVGPKFTWSNHRNVGFIAKKLDKVFVNDHYDTVFPSFGVEFLAPGFSNHCVGLIRVFYQQKPKPRSFKFFYFP